MSSLQTQTPSTNRVAVVTGAAIGLGKSIALRLARDGYDVVVTDLPGSSVQGVAREIEALGRRSLSLHADVAKEQEVEKLVEDVASAMGSIDIVCALSTDTSRSAHNRTDGRQCRHLWCRNCPG